MTDNRSEWLILKASSSISAIRVSALPKKKIKKKTFKIAKRQRGTGRISIKRIPLIINQGMLGFKLLTPKVRMK